MSGGAASAAVVSPPPISGRIRDLFAAALRAPAGLSVAEAGLLLLAAGVSALADGRHPVYAALAAFAAGIALGSRTFGGSVASVRGCLIAIALTGALAVSCALGVLQSRIGLTLAAAAIAAALGGALAKAQHPHGRRQDAAGFVAAAQRHPWVTTLCVGAMATLDAVAGQGSGRDIVPATLVVSTAAPMVAVALTARSPDILGRLAPIVFGVPLAGAAAAASVALENRNGPVLMVGGAAAALSLWPLLPMWPLTRRDGSQRIATGLAKLWPALAAAACGVLAVGGPGPQIVVAGLLIASPFIVSAAAERGGSGLRSALVWSAILGVAAAIAVAAAGAAFDDPSGFGRRTMLREFERFLGLPFGRRAPHWFRDAPRAWRVIAPSAVAAVRFAEAGLLIAFAGRLLRAARSVTAIQRDHAVFTEGPYVRVPWTMPRE